MTSPIDPVDLGPNDNILIKQWNILVHIDSYLEVIKKSAFK